MMIRCIFHVLQYPDKVDSSIAITISMIIHRNPLYTHTNSLDIQLYFDFSSVQFITFSSFFLFLFTSINTIPSKIQDEPSKKKKHSHSL